MGQGDDQREGEGAGATSDRAAILARRRRFVALALTGLASAGCTSAPMPCLSQTVPEDEGEQIEGEEAGADPSAPFVEDPGAPVQSTDPEGAGDSGGDAGEELEPTPRPEVCLNMVRPPPPRPCLKQAAPQPKPPKKTKSPAHPCLLIMDVD